MAEYMDQIITRCAPRWAWEVIEEALDAHTDNHPKSAAILALKAMVVASASTTLEYLSPEETEKANEDN